MIVLMVLYIDLVLAQGHKYGALNENWICFTVVMVNKTKLLTITPCQNTILFMNEIEANMTSRQIFAMFSVIVKDSHFDWAKCQQNLRV